LRCALRLLLPLVLAWTPAAAQQLVTSPGPDSVSVTVYRDPNRSTDDFIDMDEEDDDLGGYALITETRTVDLPPGPVTIRFEGVASGIQPESAIVQGIDSKEKNQDGLLLSRRGLLDAFTGQRVVVRRTDRATGKATEEPARIRSGPNGVVIETAAGFESLYCTHLPQTPIFPGVPPGLSAKPVLSVTTGEQPGGRRQVMLSYLTGNFDWQANYVAELTPDARRVDLFAWVTLASQDDVGFTDAQANAVAGRVAREEQQDEVEDDRDDYWEDYPDRAFLNCWPSGTTGSPSYDQRLGDVINDLPQVQAPIAIRSARFYGLVGDDGADIVLTGTRIATQEELGDLKLYRIPFPVTIAPRSQKQVAFLSKSGVKGTLLYRSKVSSWGDAGDPELLFRFRNLEKEGLGQPLPTGQVAMFQTVGGRRLLLGETTIEDKAVGEEVELRLPEAAANVDVDTEELKVRENWTGQRLEVSNANPFPIRFEAEFRNDDETRFERFGARMREKDGKSVWSVLVPANGRARLVYREVELDDPEED
jgi:hypothetical protein